MAQQSLITYLFVPATNRKFIDHMVLEDRWDPDYIIFDFEDAIRDVFDLENEGSLKICARETLLSYLPFPKKIERKYLLRINPVNSAAFEADIRFLEISKEHLPRAIVLPKVESAAQIHELERSLPGPLEIIPLIESSTGVRNIDSILGATPRIKSFCFGHIDFFFELGSFPLPRSVLESEQLASTISFLIDSARRLKKMYIDIGFYYRGRHEELARHCSFLVYASRGRLPLGKLVIHPDQIEQIKKAPLAQPDGNPLDGWKRERMTAADIQAYARNVIKAYEERPDKSSGVCLMDDTILTAQMYILAKRYLNK
jgi:citrate lyase subunit beta/citryl-CoA lyase